VEEGAVVLPFARVELPKEISERIAGQQLLIAGIRPEHFEDAKLLDAAERGRGVTFKAHVDVTEWLGNELFAYIPFEAPPEVTDRLKSLARELDSESLRTQLVVSLDTASHIQKGEEAELWFDSSRMHLFDPASGENLTRDLLYATT
jgi:multiple sugar transport system ATP-binding protein